MPLRSDWSQQPCSIARGVEAVGDPWVLMILREVLSGTRRFDVIRDCLQIADNMLAARLRTMVASGLLERHPYHDGRRTRQEYRPTQAARDAVPILHAFSLWAGRHASESEPATIRIICRRCDVTSQTGESCSGCGQRLTVASTAWVRPSSKDGVPVPLVG